MSKCYLTAHGRILLAKMLASDRLLYTRAVTSSVLVNNPEQLSSLPSEIQSAEFFTSEQLGNACRLTVQFSCKNLEQSYHLKMLGIYAKSEAEQQEVLYKIIVYASDEESISLPAGEDISYKFVITDSISKGELTVETADALAAPIEHVYNPYRHLFSQTNNDNITAVVDCGSRNTFADGQKIVFIPKASLSSNNACISCAGTSFRVKCLNLAGESVSYVFVPNQSYVLTYRNSDNSFIYTKHNEIEIKNGVAHYWTGTAWKTVIEAGRIISSMSSSIPPGTIWCKGQSLLKDEYPELYAALGDKFGTADNDHFNVPDLRGRFVCGASGGNVLGNMGGTESNTLTADCLPSHSHAFEASTGSKSHSHALSITLSASGLHQHKNGMCDDSTDLFWEGYGGEALLQNGSHRAIAADVNPMAPTYTGLTSSDGNHTHSVTASCSSASQSFSISGTTKTSGQANPAAVNNMPPYINSYHYMYTGKVLL